RPHAKRAECLGVYPLEANLVANIRKKNRHPARIEHFDWRAAKRIPARRHGAAGNQRLAARNEEGPLRHRCPWRGAARERKCGGQSTKKRPAWRESIHIDAVVCAKMQADDALLRQAQKCCDFGKILAMRRIVTGGDMPALPADARGRRSAR